MSHPRHDAPAVREHPAPRLPVHPVLSMDTFRGPKAPGAASLLDVGPPLWFTSGRFGLAKALQLAGVAEGDEVLLPAYNCPAMVAPISWLGARPVFYRIQDDLTIDLVDIGDKTSDKTKCVIAVHYFGLIQDLAKLRAFCDIHGALLIEDCAHAFFGEHASSPVGTVGDFAFGSLMKFFPLYDGGILVSSRSELDGTLRRGGLEFELKSALDAVERGHHYRQLPFPRILGAALAVKTALRSRSSEARGPIGPASSEGGYAFEAQWSDVRMSATSKWILERAGQLRIVEARRRNYELLLRGLTGLQGCSPLLDSLPAHSVPYVFPVLVEDSRPVFSALKREGVPLLRWEDAVVDPCPVSARYSEHLFLLPCHQGLSRPDVEWIAGRVADALRATGGIS